MARGRRIVREIAPPPSLEQLLAGPRHFADFAKQWQAQGDDKWWRDLEAAGGMLLSPACRYSLLGLLYRHATRPTRLPAGALDEFIEALAGYYRALGGSVELRGRHYEATDHPFEKFLRHIFEALPVDRRPHSTKALVKRVRTIVGGKLDWSGSSDSRLWDSEAGLHVTLRVVAPPDLTRALRKRFSIGGRKIGERFLVPANLTFEKPRLLEPVSNYWRKRLREGSVKIIKTRAKIR
jgi:hypothetical protein